MLRERPIPFAVVVPTAVAATIFAFACGSSSVAAVAAAGRPLRWVMLFVLLGLCAGWALAVGARRPALPSASLAAVVVFAGLALVSAAWSVDPRLTVERAISLIVLLAVAAALGHVASVDRDATRRILLGLLGGGVAVAVAGLVVLGVDHHAAVEAATHDLPARYQGLGENPDTAALLLALCFPLVTWVLLRARGARAIAVAVALAVLVDGSVVASGSRGSLIAGFAGAIVVAVAAPRRPRARAAAAVATAALLAVSIAISLAPKSRGYTPAEQAAARRAAAAAVAKESSTPRVRHRYVDVQAAFPLDFDIGTQVGPGTATPRTLFGLSGRGIAWRGALDQADERPLLGYGFGTEGDVFVDRYANFVSSLVEDSYIGLDLQLGAIGLVALVALVVALLAAAARSRSLDAVAPAAVVVVGLALGFVQSYLYSAGNIGTLAFWVAGFVGAAALARRRAVA